MILETYFVFPFPNKKPQQIRAEGGGGIAWATIV